MAAIHRGEDEPVQQVKVNRIRKPGACLQVTAVLYSSRRLVCPPTESATAEAASLCT